MLNLDVVKNQERREKLQETVLCGGLYKAKLRDLAVVTLVRGSLLSGRIMEESWEMSVALTGDRD